MRAYEPSLVVSSAGAKDEVNEKVNFTNEHLTRLQKIEAMFMPRIVKGYIQGRGWMYGLALPGKEVILSPTVEKVSAALEEYWVEFFDSTRPSDFDHCIKIQAAIKDAAGFEWE
jgi:hypothetical protein